MVFFFSPTLKQLLVDCFLFSGSAHRAFFSGKNNLGLHFRFSFSLELSLALFYYDAQVLWTKRAFLTADFTPHDDIISSPLTLPDHRVLNN